MIIPSLVFNQFLLLDIWSFQSVSRLWAVVERAALPTFMIVFLRDGLLEVGSLPVPL